MKLYITRHGQTVEQSEQHIILGTTPGHLSVAGREQATKLAQRLKTEPIEVLYSSDLNRTRETAQIIMEAMPEIPFYFTTELQERFLGEYEGKPKAEIGWGTECPRFLNPPDGEHFRDTLARMKTFWDKIYKKYSEDNILLVGHSDALRAFFTLVMGKPFSFITKQEGLANCSLTILEIDDKKTCQIVLWNDISHLVPSPQKNLFK